MNARDLNFEAMDQLLEYGFEPKALLEELVRSMDAYQVNDHFAFICRMNDLDDLPCREELDKYETDTD